jgi:hypothetical protein
MPVARFLAELAGMCAVICIGASVLSLASFAIAKALGYSNLAQQPLELPATIVTICLARPWLPTWRCAGMAGAATW